MSLINDALRKAEGGKGHSDPFSKIQNFESPSPPKRRFEPRKVLFGVGILVIGLGGVIFQGVTMTKRQAIEKGMQQLLNTGASLPTEAGIPSPVVTPPPKSPLIKEVPKEPLLETPPIAPRRATSPLAPLSSKAPFALSGIVQGPGEAFAIVNHQITRVGEDVYGAVLVEIRKESILLEAGGKRFQLKLK